LEDLEATKDVQGRFPHLVVVSDAERKLTDAAGVLHRGSKPGGGDTSAPTTFLIDGTGTVQKVFRPDRVTSRLSPSEVLDAVAREMPAP
jgi:peroxiredoxin